jgi:glyoxylase-like metal-dependent hydrolase (beta-lactamase superfamily II)
MAAASAAAAHPITRAIASYRQDAPPTVFDWTQINDNAFLIADHGGNAVVARTKDAIVLIDAKNAGFGPSLRREIVARLGGAPDFLVNTHHHADHTGGNESFSGTAQIAAHHNAFPRIQSQADSYIETIGSFNEYLGSQEQDIPETALLRQDAAPLMAGAGDLSADSFMPTKKLHDPLPGQEVLVEGVETIYVTNAHTDNDVAVFFPELNILHTGDLFFHKLHPFIRLSDGASIDGWIETLVEIYKVCNGSTVVVPGHGEVTYRDEISKQIMYWRNMKRIVQLKIENGESREQILLFNPQFCRDYGFGRLRQVAMGAVYDTLIEQGVEPK